MTPCSYLGKFLDPVQYLERLKQTSLKSLQTLSVSCRIENYRQTRGRAERFVHSLDVSSAETGGSCIVERRCDESVGVARASILPGPSLALHRARSVSMHPVWVVASQTCLPSALPRRRANRQETT